MQRQPAGHFPAIGLLKKHTPPHPTPTQNELTELNIKSIDHISLNSKVSVANMKDTKEPTNIYDIVIFCLSLSWGGEEEDYLKEDN